MPVHNKARTSSGRLQHHHRTSSGGSSKVGLNNLHLTQKEAVQPKQQNLKMAGHSAIDLHSRQSHLTSNQRVHSKDRIAAQQKRSHSTLSIKGKQPPQPQQQQQHQRAGFSIAHSDETDDDDEEWVSSESGAVTPQNYVEADADDDDDAGGLGTTPVEQQRAGEQAPAGGGGKINGTYSYGKTDRAANGVDDVTTPRAELDLTRVETVTARPEATLSSQVQAAVAAKTVPQTQPQPPPIVRVQPQSTPASPVPPPSAARQPPTQPPIRQARSEAPSPSGIQQKTTSYRRQPLIRRSSAFGDTKADMPPHPLIRGQSYHGSALRPSRLAPLTVNQEAAQAQLTASPSSAKPTSRAGSPSFLKSPSEASSTSQDYAPTRRGSISSLHSIATLPAPSTARVGGGRAKQDRTRTLSTISTSSSSAALSALAMLPGASRPGTPPTLVRFPPETHRNPQEGIHQLLPPPYLASHMIVTSKHNPLFDSYERVMRAKLGR